MTTLYQSAGLNALPCLSGFGLSMKMQLLMENLWAGHLIGLAALSHGW